MTGGNTADNNLRKTHKPTPSITSLEHNLLSACAIAVTVALWFCQHTLYHFLFAQNIKGHDATDSRLKTEDTSSHYFLQGIEFETFNPPLFETQNEADMFRTAPQTEL